MFRLRAVSVCLVAANWIQVMNLCESNNSNNNQHRSLVCIFGVFFLCFLFVSATDTRLPFLPRTVRNPRVRVHMMHLTWYVKNIQ